MDKAISVDRGESAMAGVPDQTRNVPDNRVDENESLAGGSEAEAAHRRLEHDADRAAKRAGERMKRDDADEFSNIGPV
jgi:hypothetical protein